MTSSVTSPISNPLRILVLQHPKESSHPLNTVGLLEKSLKNIKVCVGLSWRNLSSALKEEHVSYKDWAVLYTGSKKEKPDPQKKYKILSKYPFKERHLKGIILLDGNWKQAKTLWWRNPWLLKCHRLVLNPQFKSEYGKLRREPRAYFISTLETVALCFKIFDKEENSKKLLEVFESFVEKHS